ncbi:MAG TPA: ABC transporter permease [Pyrinomonadaceae bacterium]|nr:ABC transporter permease [Pyrinomonadaceae bacterium]
MSMKKEVGIFILLVVLCIIVAVINPKFLLAINLQNLARQIGAFGIFSIGLGLVIITGGIELSVGSMMALLGVLLAMMLTEWNWGMPLAILGCFALAMSLSFMHGLLITRMNMQPFIVTLCGLLVYRGLARFITNDDTKGFGTVAGLDFLRYLANGNLLGIPMPFVLLIIISLITWVLLHWSVYGRYLFATGRNAEAARYAGINTRRIITLAYVISGALTAISGIIFAFYTNSVSPANHGNAYELYGIAAAVLGGCSLRGGEGSVIGIVIGTALLQVLRNLVNLLGIPSSLDFAVMGAVILIGVMADQIFAERRNRRQVVLMRESARADMRPANPIAADHSGGTGQGS